MLSKRTYLVIKRVIDRCASGAVLIAASPVLMAVAVSIKATDPGPVLFRQQRAGQDGVPFEILKFRTMNAAAPATSAEAYAWSDGVPDDFVFKSSGDHEERMTRTGSLLRRWSLDELPQLVNVWRGEMSLVGPRPELLEIVECYSADQRRRLEVRPGITGWAQVNGRSGIDHGRKIAADLYYVDHASLAFDLKILVRTLKVALTGSHSY
ncbi:sugar transferase [Phycicoccus sp. M110.8]|uniref:sugar transferase n=1 Tax=Phycicoccus sp. M110.8 TaxID=3075433 RepID=UPI0028FD7BA9|nr:sugar transferase [Phycicoccus sp. M110.8]MDU0314726.1 sugar transferase [Phycicoccus sp. M110.8]